MKSVYDDRIKFILEKCPFKPHRSPEIDVKKTYKHFNSAKELRNYFSDVRYIYAGSERRTEVGGEQASVSGIIYYAILDYNPFSANKWGGK